MKLIMILLFCLSASRADSATRIDNGDDEMITCLIENGLDPGIYIYNHRTLDSQLPTEDQKNCYLACMFKKIGYIQKNGTFNVDIIVSTSYAVDRRKEGKLYLDELITKCKLQGGDDVCKLARCYQDLRKSPKLK